MAADETGSLSSFMLLWHSINSWGAFFIVPRKYSLILVSFLINYISLDTFLIHKTGEMIVTCLTEMLYRLNKEMCVKAWTSAWHLANALS